MLRVETRGDERVTFIPTLFVSVVTTAKTKQTLTSSSAVCGSRVSSLSLPWPSSTALSVRRCRGVSAATEVESALRCRLREGVGAAEDGCGVVGVLERAEGGVAVALVSIMSGEGDGDGDGEGDIGPLALVDAARAARWTAAGASDVAMDALRALGSCVSICAEKCR